MKNFIIFNFLIFFFLGIGFIVNQKNILYSFMSPQHTTIIKGIGALLVLWGHVALVNGINGLQFIAGTGVSLFLISSGYGLEESFKKKGLKDYWKKRVIKLIIPYYTICLLGYFIRNYPSISYEGVLRILNFKYQWFINFILINYLIFFIVKKFISTKVSLYYFIFFYIIWFIFDSYFIASDNAPFLRSRQIFAFLSGIIISDNKDISQTVLNKKSFGCINLFIGLSFMAISYTKVIRSMPFIISNIFSLFTVVPLAYAIIGLTYNFKILFNNKFIFYSGIISYEMYLIHSNFLYLSAQNEFQFFIFFILVFGLSYILKKEYHLILKTEN